jgi:hypothetical protein
VSDDPRGPDGRSPPVIRSIHDVRALISRIGEESDDDESAHAMEDGLYLGVLIAIADGLTAMDSPEDVAREALKAREISFSRWTE